MYEYKAEVLRVVDGDTLECRVDLGFSTFIVEHIRILDYDAPETKLYKGVTEQEKLLGHQAKAFAMEFFSTHPNVTIKTSKDGTGKYGRYLAKVTICENGVCIDYATMMISEGFVK